MRIRIEIEDAVTRIMKGVDVPMITDVLTSVSIFCKKGEPSKVLRK
jgi:predicted PilT family ATPase